ncbi:hypothetical protein EON63_17870 [archaeon]|nr:MAG: hypothetical protein EON63_17870 [archaeon]
MSTTASRILQILDHVGIYLVIAGSYTPFLLIALHHYTSARVLLTGQWIMAFLGSTFASKLYGYTYGCWYGYGYDLLWYGYE